jgi:hypothetical protein
MKTVKGNIHRIDKRTLKGWGRTHQQKLGDRKRRTTETLWDKFCEFCGMIVLGIIVVSFLSFF